MAYPHVCPICLGAGKIKTPGDDGDSTARPSKVTCHGCDGKGWIEVGYAPSITTPWKIHYEDTSSNIKEK